MKKTLLLILVILLSISSVFAFGNKEEDVIPAAVGDENTPGWTLNADKPITLRWYINFSWFARQWGDSAVSKYITDQTGVDIEFIVPAGNEGEKLNSMIAGDTLPDFITIGWYEGQVAEMIAEGLVLPLDVLAEEYDPYFFKVASEQKLNWYRQSDGHVYGYPNSSYTPEDYEKYAGQIVSNETFLVRKDIYEAIGSPDMSTPEGFLDALRAARELYPEVNGQPLIPVGFQEFTASGNASLEKYLLHFLAFDSMKTGLYEDSRLGVDDPDYVTWLKTFRQAHEEGLITMDVFTDKRSQIEEKAAQGRYFCMFYQNWDMQASQMALYEKDPDMVYIAVEGPKNSNGDDHTLGSSGVAGWTITLISKNCKDPARAIQFLTYLISEEGQMATNFGIEGVTYEYVDGVPTLLPEIAELDRTDKNKQETEYGIQYTYWMLMDSAWQEQFEKNYSPALAQPQLWTRPYVKSFAEFDNIELVTGSDLSYDFSDIQREWGRILPRLILAETEEEFDEIWSEYQSYKEEHNYRGIQEFQTEKIKENKAKLGLE